MVFRRIIRYLQKLKSQFSSNVLLAYFLFGTIVLAGVFLAYTQHLIRQLDEENKNISRSLTNFLLELPTSLDTKTMILVRRIVVEDIVRKLNFPFVLTDSSGEVQVWVRIEENGDVHTYVKIFDKTGAESLEGFKNLGRPPYWMLDGTEIINHTKDLQMLLEQELENMDALHSPQPIYANPKNAEIVDSAEEGILIGHLHYGESDVMHQLRWMPFTQTILVGVFILMGLISYRAIKISEQRSIWVGMAKETAHQLGTPISSLMGWVEFLKLTDFNTQEESEDLETQEIVTAMESDIKRLQKVASRFSKIGSMPDLKRVDVNEIINQTVSYYKIRLPKLSQSCIIKEELEEMPKLLGNRDLLEWVLENLVKNSVQAILDCEKNDNYQGEILIKSSVTPDDLISITVQDNGKGISVAQQKQIFKPGFTTKKRGWGLGLALAKRIVEEYHQGLIRLVESEIGRGTKFEILIPVTSDKTKG
jgi:signal transduction histidine kinase